MSEWLMNAVGVVQRALVFGPDSEISVALVNAPSFSPVSEDGPNAAPVVEIQQLAEENVAIFGNPYKSEALRLKVNKLAMEFKNNVIKMVRADNIAEALGEEKDNNEGEGAALAGAKKARRVVLDLQKTADDNIRKQLLVVNYIRFSNVQIFTHGHDVLLRLRSRV